MKQKFLFAVAILTAIVAASLMHFYLQTKNKEYAQKEQRLMNRYQMVNVVASGSPLTVGTIIETKDLGYLPVSVSSVSDLNILVEDLGSIIGKKLTQTIDDKTPILWSFIEGGRERSGSPSEEIPDGFRAVSIPVSGASGVSGLVRPNDSVDVLGSFSLPSPDGGMKGDEMELVTMTVLQRVTVLAIGSETHRSVQNNPRGASGGYGSVTLLVTPREAEVLVFAQQQMRGRLFLSLRKQSDVSVEKKLPRVDFGQIEKALETLNETRQEKNLRGRR